ncbi:FMN-binding protein [Micrococcus porci]|uniref:FMN-binding protein n=1 Tax=Micrococcus porci TaxID=2856555 RepID=UPI003CEEF159
MSHSDDIRPSGSAHPDDGDATSDPALAPPQAEDRPEGLVTVVIALAVNVAVAVVKSVVAALTGSAAMVAEASTSASGTYTGAAARTPYGPVQVQVTVSDGQVASVQALTYPYSSGCARAVDSRAIPVLDQEATASQGTSVHMVSGASFTSAAYEQSLQSALDRAHL